MQALFSIIILRVNHNNNNRNKSIIVLADEQCKCSYGNTFIERSEVNYHNAIHLSQWWSNSCHMVQTPPYGWTLKYVWRPTIHTQQQQQQQCDRQLCTHGSPHTTNTVHYTQITVYIAHYKHTIHIQHLTHNTPYYAQSTLYTLHTIYTR